MADGVWAPLLNKVTWKCAPIIGVLHCSSSQGKLMLVWILPGWIPSCSWNNTQALNSGILKGSWELAHPVCMYCRDMETVSLLVSWRYTDYEVLGLLLWGTRFLHNWSENWGPAKDLTCYRFCLWFSWKESIGAAEEWRLFLFDFRTRSLPFCQWCSSLWLFVNHGLQHTLG